MSVSRLVFSLLVAILILLVAVGCVSSKEVVYKRISFADTNGVTTIYYPESFEKHIVVDNGIAKPMLVKP
jgi:ABC-type Zn uptake system ZnuABC Zn-binding protein ZnuA